MSTRLLPTDPNFHSRAAYISGRCRCRICLDAALAYNREWTARNKERRSRYVRKSRMLRTYGITVEEHAQMVEDCGNRCYICGEQPNAASKNHNKLHVDHDHHTGEVRGLLCNQCNRAIGLMKESPRRLRTAAIYLEESRCLP